MAEYAGYKAQTPINLGDITSNIASNIIGIREKKREEDIASKKLEVERLKELGKEYRESTKDLGKWERTIGKSYNEFALGVVRDTADFNYELKRKQMAGEISANEYTAAYNNLKSNMDNLNSAGKSITTGYDAIVKDSSKQSPIGLVMNQMYANSINFQNKKMVLDSKGRALYFDTDENGNIIKESTPVDASSIVTYNKFQDFAVDYNKRLDELVKGIGENVQKTKGVTVSSIKNNPLFNKAKEDEVTSLTSTPLNTARFLTSMGGYGAYNTESDRQELINQGVDPKKLIQIGIGPGGAPQPIIDEKLTEKAKELAREQIDSRVSEKHLENQPRINVKVGREPKPTAASLRREEAYDTSNQVYNDLGVQGVKGIASDQLKKSLEAKGWKNPIIQHYKSPESGSYVISGKRKVGANYVSAKENINSAEDINRVLSAKKPGEALFDYRMAKKEVGGQSSSKSISRQTIEDNLDNLINAGLGIKNVNDAIKWYTDQGVPVTNK